MPRIKALIDPDTACRRCPVRCDKIVFPTGCIESACQRLYAYEESDRTFVGCLDRVFGVELDLDVFHRIEAATAGFGALRAVREPHPFCQTDVDPAFEHRAAGVCVNPDFLLSATRHPLRVTERDGRHGERQNDEETDDPGPPFAEPRDHMDPY